MDSEPTENHEPGWVEEMCTWFRSLAHDAQKEVHGMSLAHPDVQPNPPPLPAAAVAPPAPPDALASHGPDVSVAPGAAPAAPDAAPQAAAAPVSAAPDQPPSAPSAQP